MEAVSGYVQMLIAATYCCDTALQSASEERGPRHFGGPHPRGLVHQPFARMRWLVTQAAHHDDEDAGQGEGCEGGKCAVRRG
jgi:hypothetical protein